MELRDIILALRQHMNRATGDDAVDLEMAIRLIKGVVVRQSAAND